MPGLSLSLEPVVATTHVVTLEPKLRQRLLKELRAYAALQQQIEVLEHASSKHKAAVAAIRAETGEKSIGLEGFKVTQVTATRRKFNPQRFITLGGDLTLYNDAHESIEGKPYERISLPGAKDDTDD